MSDLFDWSPPPEYPERPGFKEPTTSRDAAEKVKPIAKTLRDMVLEVLRIEWPAGLTADEVAVKLNKREFSIRPRLSELRALGAIEPMLEEHPPYRSVRRPNTSRMSAIVWVATRSYGEWS